MNKKVAIFDLTTDEAKMVDLYTVDEDGNRVPNIESEWRVPTKEDLNLIQDYNDANNTND